MTDNLRTLLLNNRRSQEARDLIAALDKATAMWPAAGDIANCRCWLYGEGYGELIQPIAAVTVLARRLASANPPVLNLPREPRGVEPRYPELPPTFDNPHDTD